MYGCSGTTPGASTSNSTTPGTKSKSRRSCSRERSISANRPMARPRHLLGPWGEKAVRSLCALRVLRLPDAPSPGAGEAVPSPSTTSCPTAASSRRRRPLRTSRDVGGGSSRAAASCRFLARPGVDGDGAVLSGAVYERAAVPVALRAGHDRREDDPYGGAHGLFRSSCFSE